MTLGGRCQQTPSHAHQHRRKSNASHSILFYPSPRNRSVLKPMASVGAGPPNGDRGHEAYHDTRAVVAVKVNGAGPYDFMVDTGATITVVDTDLVDQLKLPIEGTGTIHSFAAASTVWRSIAREIMVGDLTVKNVAIVSMKNPLLGSERPSIRGILGENFLHHFELLIDNQHRQVTLDIGNELAASLHGEHLVIRSTPTLAEQGEFLRPRLSVRIQDMGDTNVLLDSGANELIVFHWGNPFGSESTGTYLKTINGKLRCSTRLSTVHFSAHNF